MPRPTQSIAPKPTGGKFTLVPPITQIDRWSHQREALDFAVEHLNRHSSPCLIRMPTGTGKTGVIACLAAISNPGCTLVLTPWKHLRKQMISDLNTDFWGKIKIPAPGREAVEIFPTTTKDELKKGRCQIFVATFTTLNDLRLEYQSDYETLRDAISLVIVDEGHYEPAVEWGKSVKGLGAKTVLLTATPYRNDLKLFRILNPKEHTKHYTHKAAVEDGIIRRVEFAELKASLEMKALSASFARKWKELIRSNDLPSQSPRAIICCSGDTDIETVVEALRPSIKAVGIHERFENSSKSYLLKDVPSDPKNFDAQVWVHQHKLTEGLDDDRFCCLVLFTRIRNDRKLVQQVGRILRTSKTDRNAPALILAPEAFSAESEWRAYLAFEQELTLIEPQHFRNVVETILKAQPSVEYFDGKFRHRFEPRILTSDPQVIVSPSVRVRATLQDFKLEKYIEDCTDTLNTQDAVILGPDINAPCQTSSAHALWVYATVGNSKLLHSNSLYELKLHTHCVVVSEGYLIVTDSAGLFPEEYFEKHTTIVPPEELSRFIDHTFRPTNVSLNSVIPYDTVFKGSDLRGHNLLNVAASLTDRVQICRALRGSAKSSGRRYIGLDNSRLRQELSEELRRSFDLASFLDWARHVAKTLRKNGRTNALFSRYITACAPPANPTPKTLCLDLDIDDIHLTIGDGTNCYLSSASCDIETKLKTGKTIYLCELEFHVKRAKATLKLQVEYHSVKRRFWFRKYEGPSLRVTVHNDGYSVEKPLTDFLNQRQELILIGLEGGSIVYQGRHFYRVDYSYAEKVLIGLIQRPKNASGCDSEKGDLKVVKKLKTDQATMFPKGTLFRSIFDREIDLPFIDHILACDDLGEESADFFAVNFESKQLAMVHAKCGDGSQISAAAFHVVVAQAMKNLVYLTRMAEAPAGAKNWKSNKYWNKTKIPNLLRTRSIYPEGKALWAKIKSDIIDASNPRLYIVLVTTGCCSPSALMDAVNDPTKRTPQVAQLLHLLDGLNGYSRQLGVQLLLRDLPFKK